MEATSTHPRAQDPPSPSTSGLDIADATPPSIPGAYTLNTPIVEQAATPTTPRPTGEYPTNTQYSAYLQYPSHNHDAFDPQSTFPSDLPSRPTQKHGFCARVFKRKVNEHGDMELGGGGGAVVAKPQRTCWKKSQGTKVLVVATALIGGMVFGYEMCE
jgi:hypothetical protein